MKKKAAIILAAGKGKRMKSDLPKVLHPIAARPMITILLDTLVSLKFSPIVVVIGHKGDEVQSALADYDLTYAWQREQLGTGHAVKMAAGILSAGRSIACPITGCGTAESPLLSPHSTRWARRWSR